MTDTPTLGPAQRLVLAYLTDEGPVISTAGHATADMAHATGLGHSHAGNLVKRLAELGYVDRSRTTLAITHEGRAAIDREASWCRRQRRRQAIEARHPVMPDAGPIGALGRFDIDAARAAAATAAVL